jgi:hypothetical protein
MKNLWFFLKPHEVSDFPLGKMRAAPWENLIEIMTINYLVLKPLRELGLRLLVCAHLADSLARLASSPSDEVSDFPLGKMRATPWKNLKGKR